MIENPMTSRIWLTKEFVRLRKTRFVPHTCSFCQYGVPWQKNTALLAFDCPQLCEIHRCHMRHGRCSATGQQIMRL